MVWEILGWIGQELAKLGVKKVAQESLSKAGKKVLEENSKNIVTKSIDWLKDENEIQKGFPQYQEKYLRKYGVVQVLGMSKGIPLENIYTPVRFLNKTSSVIFTSIQDMEKDFRETAKRRFQKGKSQRKDDIYIDYKDKYLMVLGGSGSGKSTFLKQLGLEAFKGKQGRFQRLLIPVFLELKFLNDEKVDLISAITNTFNQLGYFGIKNKTTERLLNKGELLLLFDGLDEMPKQNRNSVIDSISNLVARYQNKNNRFVVSCRTAAYNTSFGFTTVELADFDDNQIKQYIDHWFNSDLDKQLDTANKCWETLNQPENKAAQELAQTPLLLTFICLVYSQKGNLPNNRSRLYKKALDILLEEWLAEKRVKQKEISEDFHTDLEITMLAEIAYEKFVADELFFTEDDLVRRIQTFLANTANNPNPKSLDGKTVLKAIAIQQGILVERAEDIYSFSHLTLQEYLTAYYICDNNLIDDLILNHLGDSRWQEVFLLVAGYKSNADSFLDNMESMAYYKFITTEKLENLLIWVERITDSSSQGGIKPVSKRAISFANAYTYVNANAYANTIAYVNANVIANAYVYAIANTYNYTNAITISYDYAIANAITKTNANANAIAIAYTDSFANSVNDFIKQVKFCESSCIYKNINYKTLMDTLNSIQSRINDIKYKNIIQNLAKEFLNVWINSFFITKQDFNLSWSELKLLEKYLYANKLIFDCKKQAVRVSIEIWEKIEERMLLPR